MEKPDVRIGDWFELHNNELVRVIGFDGYSAIVSPKGAHRLINLQTLAFRSRRVLVTLSDAPERAPEP